MTQQLWRERTLNEDYYFKDKSCQIKNGMNWARLANYKKSLTRINIAMDLIYDEKVRFSISQDNPGHLQRKIY